MDFEKMFERLVGYFHEKEERDLERYKHLGFREHFDAGYSFRDRQYRREVQTIIISILLTVVVMGSGVLVADGGLSRLQHLLGVSGGDVRG